MDTNVKCFTTTLNEWPFTESVLLMCCIQTTNALSGHLRQAGWWYEDLGSCATQLRGLTTLPLTLCHSKTGRGTELPLQGVIKSKRSLSSLQHRPSSYTLVVVLLSLLDKTVALYFCHLRSGTAWDSKGTLSWRGLWSTEFCPQYNELKAMSCSVPRAHTSAALMCSFYMCWDRKWLGIMYPVDR